MVWKVASGYASLNGKGRRATLPAFHLYSKAEICPSHTSPATSIHGTQKRSVVMIHSFTDSRILLCSTNKLQPAQVGAGWSPINWIMIRLYALFNFNYSYSFIISRFCFVFVDTCLSEFLTCGTPYYFIVTIILTFIITQ